MTIALVCIVAVAVLLAFVAGAIIGHRLTRGLSPVANPFTHPTVTAPDEKKPQKPKPQESL